MTPVIDNAFITITPPTSLPLSNVLLELVVLACAAATLAHALRQRRAGDLLPLHTWVTVLLYGLAMEILSYNLFDNFTHGRFTVMFYQQQLPLYVTAVYPAFLYTGIMTIRRLGLSRFAEPFAAGLVIVAMDFPFDILGPQAGWWRWSPDDPNLAARWHGVPVTSYYWHLAFGGLLALVTRILPPRTVALRALWRAVPAAVVTIVLGMIAFGPFHGLKRAGVPDGAIVGAALSIALAITARGLFTRRTHDAPDPLLLSIPVLFYGYHLAVAVAIASGAPLAVILAVTLGAAVIHTAAHHRVAI